MKSRFHGTHAIISLAYKSFDKPVVIKVFGKKDPITSEKVAFDLIRLQKRYQEIAEQLGINVVRSLDFYLTENKLKTRAFINEIQPLIKYDLVTFLSNGATKLEVLDLLHQYLSAFQKVWKSNFLISLDPSLSNFGVNEKGVLTYFDFYPAFQKLLNKTIFIWPPLHPESKDFFIDHYFTKLQSRVIYAQLLRILSRSRKVPLETIRKLIVNYLGKEAGSLITFTKEDFDRLEKDPTGTDLYIIRIIAGEACYRRKINYHQLSHIFEMTHIDYDNQFPKISKIKKALEIIFA